MSAPKYETPEQLIDEIKSEAKDMSVEKITFPHEGIVFIYNPSTLNVETRNGSYRMTLEKFGERYKESGLIALLKAIVTHDSVLKSI